MDARLLELLVCPLCKNKLILAPNQDELICKTDKLAYPIHDQIPIMLIDQAREWQPT